MDIPAPLQQLLDQADVRIDGSRPWDIRLHNPGVLRDVLVSGSLGFGEAYGRGEWDCDALDQLFARLMQASDIQRLGQGRVQAALRRFLADRMHNLQSLQRSKIVARRHYDIHPQVYEAMLDHRRIYSCGYWEHAETLEQAQEHKLRMICEKLCLEPGLRLLDIGCGWGGLAAYAAEHYGVEVVGITLSVEQWQYARTHWQGLPLRFELCDYRQLDQLGEAPFDRIVSVGMYEHVGPRNARIFFRVAAEALRDEGLFLLHTIGYYRYSNFTDPWIDAYVFPNGRLPSPGLLAGSLEQDFLIEDWHNFGADYDLTLMAWYHNFLASWPSLRDRIASKADKLVAEYEDPESFFRFWSYYLLCCAGFFRSRKGQLWQIVLSKISKLSNSGSSCHLQRPTYRSIRPASMPFGVVASR